MAEPVELVLPTLSFESSRRFGIELEINAFDGKNRPEPPAKKPAGTEQVALLVKDNCDESVDVKEYEHTNENANWVIKPDSSCGIEICTPPFKGWKGVEKIARVVDAFGKDEKIVADKRCSVHIHVEVKDLSEAEIGSVVAHWIKCEPLLLDLMPPDRKVNRYCQSVAMTTLLEHDVYLPPKDLIFRIGDVKYYSINTHQMRKTNMERKTLEFRVLEGAGCVDPFAIKNWIKLVLHFVERTSKLPYPRKYTPGDQWSSLLWLDTEDFMRVLGFSNNPPEYQLSNALIQTRNWTLARLIKNMYPDVSKGPRWKAYKELTEMLDRFKEQGLVITENDLHPKDLDFQLYDEKFRY